METVRVTTSQNIDIDYEVAGLGERMVAAIIDNALFFLVYLLAIIMGISLQVKEFTILVLVIVYVSLYVFYDLVCEAFIGGQTIGKRIMKIKVISLDGGQPRFGQFLLRWVFRIIDSGLTAYLGAIISIAVTEKRQRIGDIVAGTTLIKTNQRVSMNNIAFVPQLTDYEPVFKEVTLLSEKDIALVQEVINTYRLTGNAAVVHAMVERILAHLNIPQPHNMNDLLFLQTIVKDYGYMATQAENA